MTVPLVAARVPKPSSRTIMQDPRATRHIWSVVAWLGGAFLAMGALDLLLAWLPVGFGNPEWEFGTISATLNGLPLPTMGLVLLLAASAGSERPGLVRGVSIVLLLLALLLVGVALLYATVLPVALSASSGNPIVLVGLKKAAVKAGTLFLLYVGLYVVVGVKGLRLSRAVS